MNEEQSAEVLAPSALMSLERAAIDSQVATAHAYPRSLESFRKQATSMATLDIETAESCIYARPVGGGKIAEGPSIRLAEIVAASYGNLRVAARIVEQTPRYVKCEGVAHDLQNNYAGKSECMEPTVMKDGKPYSESQRAVVAKACLAKAYRDAVFKVVPRAMCKSVITAAKGVISKTTVTLEERRRRVREWLKQINVEEARAFAVLEVKGWSEVTDDHLITLTGLRTGINDGDVTVEEAFPAVTKKPDFGQQSPPVQQQDKPTEKPSGKPKARLEGVTTPAPTAKPAPAQPSEATQGTESPVDGNVEVPQGTEPAEFSESEDDGGLGPQPAVEPFQARTGENDALTNVRRLMHEDGVSEAQVCAHLKTIPGMLKEGQKLADLSTAKLLNVAKAWSNFIQQMRG